jgi:hypothetical protein
VGLLGVGELKWFLNGRSFVPPSLLNAKVRGVVGLLIPPVVPGVGGSLNSGDLRADSSGDIGESSLSSDLLGAHTIETRARMTWNAKMQLRGPVLVMWGFNIRWYYIHHDDSTGKGGFGLLAIPNIAPVGRNTAALGDIPRRSILGMKLIAQVFGGLIVDAHGVQGEQYAMDQ